MGQVTWGILESLRRKSALRSKRVVVNDGDWFMTYSKKGKKGKKGKKRYSWRKKEKTYKKGEVKGTKVRPVDAPEEREMFSKKFGCSDNSFQRFRHVQTSSDKFQLMLGTLGRSDTPATADQTKKRTPHYTTTTTPVQHSKA
ncbi:hypothetical protein M0804_004486 [Polistes exclamans]|nr:hypothetical protein M0804_004486 [Polistes exclamans]